MSARVTEYRWHFKSVCDPVNISLAIRARANILLLIRALFVAYLIIAGILTVQIIADLLYAAWLPAVLSVGGFSGAVWYIVRDLRRTFRLAAARRGEK